MSNFVYDESGDQIVDENTQTVVAELISGESIFGSSMLDIAISVYSPTGSILVEDVVSASDGTNSPIYALTYEDTPDGCGAGSITIGLYYEQFYDLGYWGGLNLVEISSGDNSLAAATVETNSGTLKCYVDTNWQFDPARGEDSQLVYLNDGVNKTTRCPLQSLGFDSAPSFVHGATSTLSSAATSISQTITAPVAGNRLIAIVWTNDVTLTGPSGWTSAGAAYVSGGLRMAMWHKIATGSESSVAVGFSSSQTATLSVIEISGGGTPTFSFDTSPDTQVGPALKTAISATQPIGSLLLAAFGIENGASMVGPYGWNAALLGNPNPSAAINYAGAFWGTYATDTNPYQAYASWDTYGTTNLASVAGLIVIPPAATPRPWIVIGMPLGGGGIPAYVAGSIIGRRRYIGQIVKRTRPNAKMPGGTITLTGLQGTLQNAIGTFLVALSAAKDVGSLCYTALAQFATSHFPFLNIPSVAGATSNYLFPPTGSLYSGNNTKVTVDEFIAYAVAAIVNGDQWNLRIGHDSTPRLTKYFDGATNVYLYNVTLDQSSWSYSALDVEVTDEDVSQTYNAIEVVGDSSSTTGATTSAIVLNTTQITALGYQIDGSPQSNNACKTVTDCVRQAQNLLEENSIPASSQTCTIYTHDDVVTSSAAPGNIKRGDVVRGGVYLTVTGFPGDAPNETGLALSVVTTLDFQKMESHQDVSFQAIVPDYATAARETQNALATALIANTGPDTGLDQYFVGQNAFSWTIVGFVVTPPLFEAVFALGSNPVNCGGTSFTLTPSANNYVWLNPSGSWTVKINDVSPVAGAIPYASFWCDATSVVGSQPRAQTGLLGIPASYLGENGVLITPTLVGSPTFTITPGKFTSQLSVQFEASNQPVDGSFSKVIAYYRKNGQPTWLQLATSVPRNATVGSDGNGAQLTGGAVSATGTYTFVLPEAANGVVYQFGFAYQSLRGSESAVTALGTSTKSLGVPAGAVLTIGTATETVKASSPTSLTVTFSHTYTLSGATDMSWVDHIDIMCGYYDPAYSAPGQVVHTIPSSNPAVSGSESYTLQFSQNYNSGGYTYSYQIFLRFVAADGSSVNSTAYAFIHA